MAQEVEQRPTLGEMIREARTEKRMSQRDLELLSGVHRNDISAYENDRRRPTVMTLERIADALGLELPWSKGRYLPFSLDHAA